MKTIFYRYPGHIQAVEVGAWLMTGFILVAVALAVFAVLSKPLALIESPWETLSIFLVLLISSGIPMYLANYYPTVGVDEQGILVKFLWHCFRVPGTQVTEIKRLPTTFGLTSVWMIRTSKLTLFHRLYGFPHPGFLIHSTMNNHKELIEEILRHIAENREQSKVGL